MQIKIRDAAESTLMESLRGALPQAGSGDPDGAGLASLITSIANKKVPVSSFARVWILGSLQARITAGYLAYWARSQFTVADRQQQLRSEAHLSAALKLFGTMGYLRGAVLKVGQMLANLPDIVPEELADVLSALQFAAPPMHFSMVREVFLDEFGREPEQIFASFERQSFAAASLGQVHRATLRSGEQVAVKIQYPGIAQTIKSDVRTLRILLQPLCLTPDWQNALDKLDDIERMLFMETDYEQEARLCSKARQVFSESDRIVVPRVFDAYCTKRVLTTEYLRGCHLNEFLAANPSQAMRNSFTHLLTLATFRMFYRLHWLPADPHPGNMIFMDDGRLGIIDFGCTLVLSDEEWQLAVDPIEALSEGDQQRLDRVIARACLFDDPRDMKHDHLVSMRHAFHWFMEPLLKEGLFDFSDREFFLRGVDNIIEMTRKRYTRSIPMTIWSTRFALGGRAVCYRLKGSCAFRSIFLQESACACKP